MTPDPIPPETGLRIAWWNTKLSPAHVAATISDAVALAAADVLMLLMNVVLADIIILGEMSDSAMPLIRAPTSIVVAGTPGGGPLIS